MKFPLKIKFSSFSFISFILGFFVFTALFFSATSNIIELYPEIPFSKFFNYQINSNVQNNINLISLSTVSSVIPTILILISISALEIFQNIKTKKFINSSILRIFKSKGHKYADIWYYFIGNILFKFPATIAFLTFGLATFNNKFGAVFYDFFKSNLIIPNSNISATLIILSAILAKDLIAYWSHRISHMVPFLWDSHEFHHSATEMTMLSAWRNDIHAKLLLAPFKLPILVFITLLINYYLSEGYVFPLILFLLDTFLSVVATFLGHSSLKVIYPNFLSSFLMHPAQHWLHHSENVEHYDCNFGEKYNFWDKLFGTYLDVKNVENIRSFGVTKTQYNNFHPLYSYILLPVIKMSKKLRINFLRA